MIKQIKFIMRCVYIPLIAIIVTLNAAVIKVIVSETGLSQPYTWMCWVALSAYLVRIYCDYKLKTIKGDK